MFAGGVCLCLDGGVRLAEGSADLATGRATGCVAGGSAVMMVTGGIESDVGKSTVDGRPVGTDGGKLFGNAPTSSGAAPGAGIGAATAAGMAGAAPLLHDAA